MASTQQHWRLFYGQPWSGRGHLLGSRRCKLLLLILLLGSVESWAQTDKVEKTGLQGRVVDALTGEKLPFVQVSFEGTTIGTTSDMDGRFIITNTQGHTKVQLRMMGYEPKEITLVRGVMKKGMKIEMSPKAETLQEVVVT